MYYLVNNPFACVLLSWFWLQGTASRKLKRQRNSFDSSNIYITAMYTCSSEPFGLECKQHRYKIRSWIWTLRVDRKLNRTSLFWGRQAYIHLLSSSQRRTCPPLCAAVHILQKVFLLPPLNTVLWRLSGERCIRNTHKCPIFFPLLGLLEMLSSIQTEVVVLTKSQVGVDWPGWLGGEAVGVWGWAVERRAWSLVSICPEISSDRDVYLSEDLCRRRGHTKSQAAVKL